MEIVLNIRYVIEKCCSRKNKKLKNITNPDVVKNCCFFFFFERERQRGLEISLFLQMFINLLKTFFKCNL